MKNKINLEEILRTRYVSYFDDKSSDILIAMKEACRQVLKLAAENASLNCYNDEDAKEYNIEKFDSFTADVNIRINKQSILNTINQVE